MCWTFHASPSLRHHNCAHWPRSTQAWRQAPAAAATAAEGKRGKKSKASTTASPDAVTALDPSSNKPLQPKDLNRRVVNCLACGKIFDCRPKDGVMNETAKAFLANSGECTFCGTLVALELTHEDAASSRGNEEAEEQETNSC